MDNQRLRDAVARLRRGPAEFFKVDAGAGLKLDGWVMKPPGFDSTRRYPVLFHVYGEPGGQTALDQWDGHYLWHLMLTQQGYVVATVDNRGTPAPRGRALRKAIYRKIGRASTPPIRRRRRERCGAGPGWTRPASAYGAGAAAGR